MTFLRKFSALLTASFCFTGLVSAPNNAKAAPKSVSGKIGSAPLQEDKAKGQAPSTAPEMMAAEPDSEEVQGLNDSGAVPLGAAKDGAVAPEAALQQKEKSVLKDVDLKVGNWMEFQKKDSAGEFVTVCGAMNHENSPFRVMFRAARGKDNLAIDAMDTRWELPPQASGETIFSVGNYHAAFRMSQKNEMTLEAAVTPKQLKPLLDALETEKKAVISFGAGGQRHVIGLNGAERVLQRFRECSLSHSFADIGGY